MKDIEKSRVTNERVMCLICRHNYADNTHHLICGTFGRSFSDEYGLTVPLCAICHKTLHENGISARLSKLLGQAIWEKNYYKDLYYQGEVDEDEAREKFLELHGTSYL